MQSLDLPAHEYEKQYQNVVAKECLCVGLSNSAILKYKLPPIKKLEAVTICPGPNIAYFNKVVSLREITDHIYGRTSILDGTERPHMFIKELVLNMNYLKEQIEEFKDVNEKIGKDLIGFCQNLLSGISYYRNLSESIVKQAKNVFLGQLQEYEKDVKILLEGIQLQLQPVKL